MRKLSEEIFDHHRRRVVGGHFSHFRVQQSTGGEVHWGRQREDLNYRTIQFVCIFQKLFYHQSFFLRFSSKVVKVCVFFSMHERGLREN